MSTTTMKAPPAGTAGAAEGGAAAKGGKKKKIIVLTLPLLLVLGGGGWFFLLRDSGPPPPPEPGEVLRLDPISINLADGHYLKLGMGLQGVLAGGHGELDGAKALDIAIEQFSGDSMAELSTPEAREAAKAEMMEHIDHDYHGDVLDVYFTEFVMQ